METPFVSIDLKTVANNIARTQAHFDGLGMALRPHIKTHKIPALARRQIDAGARGITPGIGATVMCFTGFAQ